MAKDYRKYRKSRLQKIEDSKNTKQALLFGFLTVVAIALIIFLGVPMMIKLAIFLGDIRSTDKPIVNTENVIVSPPTLYSSFEATNSAKVQIKGKATEHSDVSLDVNGRVLHEETDLKGEFAFTNVRLDEGKNVIIAIATKDGVKSNPSKALKIVLDQKPPEITIDSPQDGDNFFDLDQQITIKGHTDLNTKVFINDHMTIVNSRGEFSFNMSLGDGDNRIVIKAIDQAFNTNQQELTVSYTP